MQQLLYTVAVLACPIGMGLMMWMMMRGQRHGDTSSSGGAPAPGADRTSEINTLRAEIEQLQAERTGRRAGGR